MLRMKNKKMKLPIHKETEEKKIWGDKCIAYLGEQKKEKNILFNWHLVWIKILNVDFINECGVLIKVWTSLI
jgi:hypothetical protein